MGSCRVHNFVAQSERIGLPHRDGACVTSPYCGGQEPLFLAAARILRRNSRRQLSLAFPSASGCWLLGRGLRRRSARCRRSPQLAFFLGLLAVFPLGGFLPSGARCRAADDRRRPAAFRDSGQDEVDVTAHVIREGLIRDSPYGGKQESVDVESEQLRLGDRVLREPIGIRLDHLQQAD